MGLEFTVLCKQDIVGTSLDDASCFNQKLSETTHAFIKTDSSNPQLASTSDFNAVELEFNANNPINTSSLDKVEFIPKDQNGGGFKFTLSFSSLGINSLDELKNSVLIRYYMRSKENSYLVTDLKKRPIDGCTDSTAFNYDPNATFDSQITAQNSTGSCIHPPACADWNTFDPTAPWDEDCDSVADTDDVFPNSSRSCISKRWM